MHDLDVTARVLLASLENQKPLRHNRDEGDSAVPPCFPGTSRILGFSRAAHRALSGAPAPSYFGSLRGPVLLSGR